MTVSTDGTNNYTIFYSNGGKETWTLKAGTTGTLIPPTASPYLVQLTAASGMTPAYITLTTKDRMTYTFTQFALAAGNYPAKAFVLTKITNLVGRSITLTRDTGSSKKHRISVVVSFSLFGVYCEHGNSHSLLPLLRQPKLDPTRQSTQRQTKVPLQRLR